MYQNNKKQMLQLILLIILILSIPLIFISLEAIQKIRNLANYDPNEVTNSTLDNFYNSIQETPKNTYASDLRKCLFEIFDLINKKDINKLYALLSSDMKQFIFPTEESLSEYINENFKNEYSPSFSSYSKLNNLEDDVYILTVDFLNKNTKSYDINNDNKAFSDTFTIRIKEDNSYNFTFLNFIGTGAGTNPISNDKYSCRLAKTYLYKNQTIYVVEIENKTDLDMYIGKEELYCVTGVLPKYYSKSIIIPAHSIKSVNFQIYTGYNLADALPKNLYIEGLHTDGLVYFITLSINYPIDI